MSNVIKYDLIKRREELLDEIDKLHEEIDILNILLKKAHSEYMSIGNKIKISQVSETAKMGVFSKY